MLRERSYHDEGTGNDVYWFCICKTVYAREQFEKPDITKEGEKRLTCVR